MRIRHEIQDQTTANDIVAIRFIQREWALQKVLLDDIRVLRVQVDRFVVDEGLHGSVIPRRQGTNLEHSAETRS
jgi:hypothetical protein